MSKNRNRKNSLEDRVYTRNDVEEILNTSRDAYRLKRLNVIRRLFIVAASFYLTVIIAALGLYLIYHMTERSDAIVATLDSIVEPPAPRIGVLVDSATGEVKTTYDSSDFSASTDELMLNNRIADIDVSLFDLKIPKEVVDECFAEHRKLSACEDQRCEGAVLRFRIVLKDNRAIEAAVSVWGAYMGATRSSTKFELPINEVRCFRGALSGSVYKDDIETNLKRRGLKDLPSGLVAEKKYECMSDAEAKRLYHMVASLAEDTRFDWGAVLRVMTLGVWNAHHPWMSFVVSIVLASIALVVNKKVFAK